MILGHLLRKTNTVSQIEVMVSSWGLVMHSEGNHVFL